MATANWNVETVLKHAAATIGEGPHWEEATGKLLYVDITANAVGRFDVETLVDEKFKVEGNCSLVVPSEGGGYIVSSQRKLCHLDWDSKKVTDIVEVPAIGTNDRFNDGKCDRQGRLWAGTMGCESVPAEPELEKGRLFTLEKGSIRTADERPTNISNGLAWTADDSLMYFIDSVPRHVYVYDFDSTNGTISNRRVAVDFNQWTLEQAGYPDGMCIDQEGKLWVAGYRSSKVMQFDPVTGQKLCDVTVPGKRTTSCCFGGKDYNELYVTCGAVGWTPEEMAKLDPLAGSIFKVSGLGAKGLPAPNYKP